MENKKDIQEVENLRNNVRWLQKNMPIALSNWSNSRKKSGTKCISYDKIIQEICDTPGNLNDKFFDPLLKWLSDYQLIREGRMAVPGQGGLDTFLKLGLRNMYRFIFVTDFFSRNPDFFITQDVYTSKGIKEQKEYQEFIDLLNSKLIGCNEQMSFIFLKLSKTIKNLSDDLIKMQKALDDHCISLKIRNLKK